MLLGILFGILLGIVAFVLFAPFRFYFSTKNNVAYVSFARYIKASASLIADDVQLTFGLFGYKKSTTALSLLAGVKRKTSLPEMVAEKIAESTTSVVPLHVIFGALKSFQVKKLYINIDFGSVYYNAWFFPLGSILASPTRFVGTNFNGKTEAEIQIENRIGRVLAYALAAHFKNNKR